MQTKMTNSTTVPTRATGPACTPESPVASAPHVTRDPEAVSRRRFLASALGLSGACVAAFAAPLVARSLFAPGVALADPAATVVEGAATSARADGEVSGPANSAQMDDAHDGLYYLRNEITMGETVALSNETDPNSTDEDVNHGLGWEGTMEVTVNSATLYQGSFNVDEDLNELDLGYIAQGKPGGVSDSEYVWTDWRLLIIGLTMTNVDAVTPTQAARDANDPKQKVDFSTLPEDVFKDFNIGSWRLTSKYTGPYSPEVATFNGTKDDPGMGEIYHYQLEPGETREFLIGYWVRFDTDFSGLYLMGNVGGQLPNGNFFKLDVVAANAAAAEGTDVPLA